MVRTRTFWTIVVMLAALGMVPASASASALSITPSSTTVKEGEPFSLTMKVTDYHDSYWANVYVYQEGDPERFVGQFAAGERDGALTMWENGPWTRDGFPDQVVYRAEYMGEVARVTINIVPAVEREITLTSSRSEIWGYDPYTGWPSDENSVALKAEGVAGFKDSVVIVAEHQAEDDKPDAGSIAGCSSTDFNERGCASGTYFYATDPSVLRFQARVLADGGEHVLARSPWVEVTLKEKREDLDIIKVASLFDSAQALCDALIHFPGRTYTRRSTVSDQKLDCDTALLEGMSRRDVIRAVTAGSAAGGAAVWWWLHSGTPGIAPPPSPGPETQPPTGTGAPLPPVRPLPVAWPVQELANELIERNPDLDPAYAPDVAAECLVRASVIGNAFQECKRLPIFASGSDVPSATLHDLSALTHRNPAWVQLNYVPSTGKLGDGWQTRQAECQPPEGGKQCHEFPFFATQQGGPPPEGAVRPLLGLIDAFDNQSQGGKYGRTFIKGCSVQPDDPFLVVPLHPSLGVPTQALCNDQMPSWPGGVS